MITKSLVRVVSGFLLVCGALLVRQWQLLVPALVGLIIYFLATRQFATLRRCSIAIAPIIIMFLGIHFMSRAMSGAHFQIPWLTILCLCTLMLTFSYTANYFVGGHVVERLIDLGLRGDVLIIALSAVSTLPLMQSSARRITEARFAAGFVRRRSIFSTATQLPFVLAPLFTQALRLAVKRSDAWQQRELSYRLRQNLPIIYATSLAQLSDLPMILLPAIWIALTVAREFL